MINEKLWKRRDDAESQNIKQMQIKSDESLVKFKQVKMQNI